MNCSWLYVLFLIFSVVLCNYFWILTTLQYRLFYYNNIFIPVILTCLSNCSFVILFHYISFYSLLQYLLYCYLLMFFSLCAVLIFFVFETHLFAFICHICNFVTSFFLRFFFFFQVFLAASPFVSTLLLIFLWYHLFWFFLGLIYYSVILLKCLRLAIFTQVFQISFFLLSNGNMIGRLFF